MPETPTAPPVDEHTPVGKLLYRSRNRGDQGARAELIRRGLDPRTGIRTTPKEGA